MKYIYNTRMIQRDRQVNLCSFDTCNIASLKAVVSRDDISDFNLIHGFEHSSTSSPSSSLSPDYFSHDGGAIGWKASQLIRYSLLLAILLCKITRQALGNVIIDSRVSAMKSHSKLCLTFEQQNITRDRIWFCRIPVLLW